MSPFTVKQYAEALIFRPHIFQKLPGPIPTGKTKDEIQVTKLLREVTKHHKEWLRLQSLLEGYTDLERHLRGFPSSLNPDFDKHAHELAQIASEMRNETKSQIEAINERTTRIQRIVGAWYYGIDMTLYRLTSDQD